MDGRMILAGANVHLRSVLADRLGGRAVVLPDLLAPSSVTEPALAAAMAGSGPGLHLVVLPAGRGGCRPRLTALLDRRLAEMLPELVTATGCTELTYVAPPGTPAEDLDEVERLCSAERVGLRVVEAGPVAGPGLPADCWARQPGLAGLAAAVRATRDHVGIRDPSYLRQHPLRLLASADATLALLDSTATADALIELTGRADTLGHRFVLAPSTPLLLAEVCALVGEASGVELRPVSEDGELTAVDRLLGEWLGEFPLLLGPGTAIAGSDRLGATAELVAAQLRVPVSRATVHVAEALPPVVLLNALDQGPGYWTRLVAALAPRRVLLVNEPGTTGYGLAGQVTGLAAELAGHGIARCHLAGWCTAAKVLVRHHHQRPGTVLSLTFVNGSFRHGGRPAELDTAYEQELEKLAAIIARRPELAGRVLRMVTEGMFDPPAPAAARDPATALLATPDPELDQERRRPFRDAEALRRYATRLAEFWSHDVSAECAEVRVPTLFVVGALDAIVAPRAQLAAAARFDRARVEVLAAGTHYLMHDHATPLADLLAEFWAEAEHRQG